VIFGQTDGPDPIVNLIQYGALGLVVVGFIIGWIWPRPAVDRLIKAHDVEAAELRAEIASLREEIYTARQEVENTVVGLRRELNDLHRKQAGGIRHDSD
jgi:hypothetical protein